MPFTKTQCDLCRSFKAKGQTRKITVNQYEWAKKQSANVNRDGHMCSKCLSKYYRDIKSLQSKEISTFEPKMVKCENFIALPFPRAGKSKSNCFICKHKHTGLCMVPADARVEIFLRWGVLIPLGVHCCKSHLQNKKLKPDVKINAQTIPSKRILAADLVGILKDVHHVMSGTDNKRLNFDEESSFTDEDLFNLTGLNKSQFADLVLRADIKPTKRSIGRPKQMIGMLLLKLRTGLSLRLIGTLCGSLKRYQVSRMIQRGKKALSSHFVQNFVGFNAISRDDVINKHTSDVAVSIFSNFLSDSAILILDGTYIYIQKSTKNKVQRKCYSMHKHRPLIKPMVVVTTTGYILSVVGPFFADGKNNDAAIMRNMINTNADGINDWLKEGDIFILDRGFRDVLELLEDGGFHTESPAFLPKSSKQFSTNDANHSRLVTKIRWAVECINGRIKSWKYFDKVVPNSDIHNVKDYLQIVAALCNCYRPSLHKNSNADCEIAQKMLKMASQENLVQKRVLSDNALLHRSKSWLPLHDLNNCLYDFPKMTEDDIRALTFGIYQVRQAASYIDEYMHGTTSQIYFRKSMSDLIHARIQSRHTSAKQYDIWVEHDRKTVTGWYCQCPIGSRTVGTCSHVASVIWFLAYARHNNYKPKKDRISPLLMDAAEGR